jgi:hypothetical protein
MALMFGCVMGNTLDDTLKHVDGKWKMLSPTWMQAHPFQQRLLHSCKLILLMWFSLPLLLKTLRSIGAKLLTLDVAQVFLA